MRASTPARLGLEMRQRSTIWRGSSGPAYPAPHFAVADGGAAGRASGLGGDYGFVYLNLRMGRGRSAAVHGQAGQKLEAVAKAHFAPLLASRPVGVTLQIDEGHEVFDARNSSLHPLFQTPQKAP
jgi:5-carboxymethyl-2-hydroxymuconate isomerase